MYFAQMPEMLYNFKIGDTEPLVVVRDITFNVRFLQSALDNITLYEEYDIVDGETPEIVSEKLYGSPHYHWLLMLANQKFDYIADFPLPYDRLVVFAVGKYGYSNINETHHYENAFGHTVPGDYPLATPITNLEYEDSVNESKRRVKVVAKTVLDQILSEFNTLTRQ